MQAPRSAIRHAIPALVAGMLPLLPGASLLAQSSPQGRVDPALFEQVSLEGAISVIVELETGASAVGATSAAAVRDQAIAGLQETMLSGLRRGRIRVRRRFSHIPYVSLEVDRQALDELAASALVSAVEGNGTFAPTQSGSDFAQNGPRLAEADLAHDAGFDGSGWTVAVIDTGVEAAHPYLGGRVVREACFSSLGDCPSGATELYGAGAAAPCAYSALECEHGTHVAGIAAGATTALTGVASGADIIAINAASNYSGSPRFAWDDVVAALEHVYDLRTSHSIAAVNMSLGDGSYATSCDSSFPAMSAAVGNLSAAGIAVVVAAGNDSDKAGIGAPACLSQAVSVGATGFDGTYQFDFDTVASFSNSSPQLDLLAPGLAIDSSIPGGAYGTKSGTSMATPHVTGAFAVLRQQNATWTPGQVLTRLQSTGFLITDTNGVTKASLRLDKALFGGTPPVANDRFVNATLINGGAGLFQGSTYPSTRELFEPFHGGLQGGSSVWFRWRTPAFFPGRLAGSLETTLSNFDTVLAVYTGSDLSNLALVATNDDIQPGIKTSRVRFAMEPNRRYYIAVDGFGGLAGDLGMFWDAQDSNHFYGRIPLSGQSGQTTSTNAYADKESGEPSHAGKAGGASIWWTWTAPTSESFVFDTAGSTFDTLLAVYTGDAVPQLSTVAADDDSGSGATSRVVFTAQAGTVYQIAVDGDAGAEGDVVLSWSPATSQDQLEVQLQGHGTVSGPGISCPSDCDESYPPGTSVTLIAAPEIGWTFVGWSGACAGQGSSCTLVTTPTTDVDAIFDITPLMSDDFESGGLSAWSSVVG